MGVDYVVIGFDMEVQPLVTHNAAWPLCVSAFRLVPSLRYEIKDK